MSDLASAFAKITIEQSQVGSAATNSLAQNIGQAANWVVENVKPSPVGSVKYSELTEAQFQAVAGAGWVRAMGQALAPTDQLRILTGLLTVPDLEGAVTIGGRGAFLRGVTGVETIDGIQYLSSNPSHGHTAIVASNNVAKSVGANDREQTVGGPCWGVGAIGNSGPFPYSGGTITVLSGGTGTEFRGKSVIMRAFIRIN